MPRINIDDTKIARNPDGSFVIASRLTTEVSPEEAAALKGAAVEIRRELHAQGQGGEQKGNDANEEGVSGMTRERI